jgi:hypothetical protein
MSGKGWQTWVWVKWKAGTPSNAWEGWKQNKLIENAWSTIGDWDCVLCLTTANPDDVEQFVWSELRRNQWVDATHTTFTKRWW